MTTLKEAIHALETIRMTQVPKAVNKTKTADELLGKYQGVLPTGKTSSEYIHQLRNNLYGQDK